MAHEAIEKRLAERIGLDPATVGRALIAGALRTRMLALGTTTLDDYVRRLDASEDELQALVEEVVIPESWFFRDDCPFALFHEHVRAGWLADPSRPPLRVLSAPCAAGEEPYSVALALLDLGLPPARFQIDAVDISAQALERARHAIYSANAFRGGGGGAALRERYFRPHARGFALDASVRGLVRFVRGNLLAPDLLADEPPYDVILCRNLLIYLDEPARRRVLDTIDRLLARPGLLFVGHAEQLGRAESRFAPVDRKGCFAYRRAEGAPKVLPKPPVPRPAARPAPPRPVAKAPAPVAPAPVAPAPAASLADQAAALAGEGQHAQAAALCERALREHAPDARTLFLLGMIRQSQGDLARAEESLRKAVYLDPRHDEALLALALLHERRGDRAAADAFRRRAGRALRPRAGETP